MINRQANREAQVRYRKKHPERVTLAQRKWKQANKEAWAAYMVAWRLKHPGYQKKLDARYRANNPSRRIKEAQKTRRRRKVLGSFTLEQWNEKKRLFGFRCPGCGKPETEKPLTVDHIIPTIKGGTNDIENIQPLCSTCNFRKQVKVIHYTPWEC